METTAIYVLKDPITDVVRYVGKANDPFTRFQQHLVASRGSSYTSRWVRSILNSGRKPILQIIDEVPVNEWPSWEVAYIEFFKESGCNLVNGTLGGDGLNGPTLETRARMSVAHKGKTLPPAQRRKISQSLKGRKFSEASLIKMSIAQSGSRHPMYGKKHSVESRERMRRVKLGKIMPEESRIKISSALRGRKLSLEHKQRISAARKNAWAAKQNINE